MNAIQGVSVNRTNPKRKSSKELEKEHKKGRLDSKNFDYSRLDEDLDIDFLSLKSQQAGDTPTSSLSRSSIASTTSERSDTEEGNMAINQKQFIQFLSAALDDKEILRKLKKSLAEDIEEIQNRVMVMEVENGDRDDVTRKMQDKIDDLEQRDRAKNIIVTGIKHDSVPSTVKRLNRKLTTKIQDEDIHYITKLKPARNDDKERIKIVFNNQ